MLLNYKQKCRYWTRFIFKSFKKKKWELTKLLTTSGNQGFVFKYSSNYNFNDRITRFWKNNYNWKTYKLFKKLERKKSFSCCLWLTRLAAVEQLKQIAAQIEVDIYFDDVEKDPIKLHLQQKKKL